MSNQDAIVNIDPTLQYDSSPKKEVTVTTEEVSSPTTITEKPPLIHTETQRAIMMGDDKLTPMGRAIYKILENPIIRYCIYILPVATLLAIPLVLFATKWPDSRIDGIRQLGLYIYLEIIWVSLWIAKLMAAGLPYLFQGICGIISTGIRKYALVLRAREISLSLLIWTIMAFCWLPIIHTFDKEYYHVHQELPSEDRIVWIDILTNVIKASIGSAAIFFGEKVLMQLISVNYHSKQYSDKIKEIKATTRAIDLLYAASLRHFPDHCKDMINEDYDIHDSTNFQKFLKDNSADRSVLRVFGDIHYFGERLVSAFGRMASDITGTEVMKPTATHSVVEAALERRAGAEALATRIFKSLVYDHPRDELVNMAIREKDILQVYGQDAEIEAAWIFAQLDRDKNGDVSLEEMILLVTGISRQRKDMWKSACNIRDAIRVLDRVLSFIILVVVALIYSAFFSNFLANNLKNIVTLMSASAFSFGQTVGEFNAACIQVFIKHPFDVGDRINMQGCEYEVVRISLLYTVFRRIDTDTIVQVANGVVGNLFIDNVSRSRAMKERYQFSVSAGTSFQDLETLRMLLEEFARSPENSRDYQPEVDIQLLSVGDLKQLDLRVEIRHKSNWANDTLRAYRRSKFMCALLSAMRKVPIDGPGGGSPALGSASQPAYSVAVSSTDAIAANDKWKADRAAARMQVPDPVPIQEPGTTVSSSLEILPNLRSGFHGIADNDLGAIAALSASARAAHISRSAAAGLFGRKPHTHTS